MMTPETTAPLSPVEEDAELIERVARAICVEAGEEPDTSIMRRVAAHGTESAARFRIEREAGYAASLFIGPVVITGALIAWAVRRISIAIVSSRRRAISSGG